MSFDQIQQKVDTFDLQKYELFKKYVVNYFIDKKATEKIVITNWKGKGRTINYFWLKTTSKVWFFSTCKRICKWEINKIGAQYQDYHINRDYSGYRYGKPHEYLLENLYNLDPVLFTERFNKLDLLIEKGQLKSQKAKVRGKKKRAQHFTKVQQIEIAKIICDKIRKNLRKDALDNLNKYANNINTDVFSEFTIEFKQTNNYIIEMSYGRIDKVDLSGQKFYDSLSESLYIDRNQLLKDWLICNNPLLRRFALLYTNSNLAIGMVDQDDLIREVARLKYESD